MGGWSGAVRLGSRWERRLWADQYADLAGWVLAVTGDRAAARKIADEAFCRVFTRLRPPHPRRILYAEALKLVNRWLEQRRSAPPSSAGGWLSAEVQNLSQRPRDCLLLHEAGLDAQDTARVLGLHSRDEVESALTLVFLQRATADRPEARDRLEARRPSGVGEPAHELSA